MIKVIMIEDDPEIAELLSNYLVQFQISLQNYPSPLLGIHALDRDSYDLMILDLSLPNMDGLEVCEIVTRKYKIPIIISSARSDVSDRVIGLQHGADDYLPKPYDPRELVARIQSILRRYQKTGQPVNGCFRVDEDLMEIYQDSQRVQLTRAEYEILKLFIEKNGYVLSREFISSNIDAVQFESCERSIDVIISRIRHKIERDVKNPKFIQSVRGIGYKFIGEPK